MSNYSTRFRFRATRDAIWGDNVELCGWLETTRDGVRTCAIAQPLQLVVPKDDGLTYETAPFVSIHRDSAQALMDELWSIGLRPSEGTGSAGSLAATERHLADMRAIVGSKLQVPLK